jgi:hypothetical protein
MARDLSFWKTSKESEDNKAVYAALSNGEHLDYIDEIPVNEIQKDFDDAFFVKGWDRLITPENICYEKGDDEAFHLLLTNQFVRVDCYSVSDVNMNVIIDIMEKYDCPLYDSAIDVRFG